MQCQVGLYFLSNSFLMNAAMSFSMLYFSRACRARGGDGGQMRRRGVSRGATEPRRGGVSSLRLGTIFASVRAPKTERRGDDRARPFASVRRPTTFGQSPRMRSRVDHRVSRRRCRDRAWSIARLAITRPPPVKKTRAVRSLVNSKSRRTRVFEETHLGGAVHGILLEVLLFAKQQWGGMKAVSRASHGRSRAALGAVAGRCSISRGEEKTARRGIPFPRAEATETARYRVTRRTRTSDMSAFLMTALRSDIWNDLREWTGCF